MNLEIINKTNKEIVSYKNVKHILSDIEDNNYFIRFKDGKLLLLDKQQYYIEFVEEVNKNG